MLPTSPSIAAPASVSLLSFNGTIASTMPNTHPSTNIHQEKQHSRPATSHFKRTSPEVKSKSNKENLASQSNQVYSKQGNSSPSSEIFKSTFVDGVGWASQVCNILFIILLTENELLHNVVGRKT
jgi:hypothetical protein